MDDEFGLESKEDQEIGLLHQKRKKYIVSKSGVTIVLFISLIASWILGALMHHIWIRYGGREAGTWAQELALLQCPPIQS